MSDDDQLSKKLHILFVFSLHPLLSLYRGGRTWALSSACKYQADSRDGICFLPSKLIEEISPTTEALSTNT